MTEQTDEKPSDDEPPAFAWHYDRFAFVCVCVCDDVVGLYTNDWWGDCYSHALGRDKEDPRASYGTFPLPSVP